MNGDRLPVRYVPHFHFQQTGAADALIYDHEALIAEVRRLQLCQARFQPTGTRIIGAAMPLPLYWWQYQDHENPERNAGSDGRLELIFATPAKLIFRASGQNVSKSVSSQFDIHLTWLQALQTYEFRILASLHIHHNHHWHVQLNPAHGELEFCDFWPEGSFSSMENSPKLYQACLVQRHGSIQRVPHHHLETRDKYDIRLMPHDRFFWIMEEVNPVFELLSSEPISAGLCAYMWDAHFGYRVTAPGHATKLLKGPMAFHAEYRLYTVTRSHAEGLLNQEGITESQELEEHPIYLPGLNTFKSTLVDFPGRQSYLWPWSHEVDTDAEGAALFRRDRNMGYDDLFSLHIENLQPIRSRWLATTLGPAFGHPPFPDRARYRLTGYLKTEDVQGKATLAIRLHRTGDRDLYHPQHYQMFTSPQPLCGSSDWRLLQVETPLISPAPDRLHLLLELEGRGKCWFDTIQLETRL